MKLRKLASLFGHPSIRLALPALCASAAFSGIAHAVIVDGFVTSTSGTPIQNADLDWFNRDTNMEVDPTGDHTDATGYFNVNIPAGRYDITVFGPPSNTFAPVFLDNVDLEVPQTMATTELAPGALLSLHVESETGAALNGMVIVVIDTATDDEVFLPNDNSNMFGDFAQVVPFGTFDVVSMDSAGIRAPSAAFDVDVAAPVNLGTFVMRPGYTVSGQVVDGSSVGLFNVDIDAVDEITGDKVYTTNDNTDLFGTFSVFLPEGSVELRFTPSPGSPFAPERRTGIAVTGPTDTGTTTLLPGVQLSGLIRNQSGVPLSGADVDVIDVATGIERYTPGDDTDGAGAFSVMVPVGTYDVHLLPPSAVDLAATALWDVAVAGATALPPVNLVPGVLITGTVTGDGLPVENVDLDFVVVSNAKEYPTRNDDTLANGTYRVRIAPDMYDVTATPTPPSAWAVTTLTGQSLFVDSVVDIALEAAVAVGDATPSLPRVLTLAPNPFRSSTVIRFSAADGGASSATIAVHDATGRRVRDLGAFDVSSGGAVVWDGRDDRGLRTAPGVYFVRIAGGRDVRALRVTRLD